MRRALNQYGRVGKYPAAVTPKCMPTIVVAGDVMIDRNLKADRDVTLAKRSSREGKVTRYTRMGGAWLLQDLVEQFAAGTPYEGNVHGVAQPTGNEGKIHRTYSVISRASDRVWRLKEFLGTESAGDGGLRIKDDDPNADIVVLLDSDLGFDRKEESEWPAAIRTPGWNPWIIFKTAMPAFEGSLWQHLIANHADKVIVVMTVDDLRRKEIQLLRRLSWERAAQDLVSEIRENPALRALNKCRSVIVSFGTAGAIVLPRGEHPRLIFDPASMEDEWKPEKKGSGFMTGYTTVLAAAVTHEIMTQPEWPQLPDAVARGIAGMRALFTAGFGDKYPDLSTAHIVTAVRDAEPEQVVATAAITDLENPRWTILEDRLKEAAKISPENNVEEVLRELAARVAVFGPDEALRNVPQLRVGKFFSVDREEIESIRSIKELLSEYVQRKPSKPLSIAVFGSPGSGKSFGVEEIARNVGGDDIQLLTFNLTQFARPEDLHGAFHQVRDVSLRGRIPVVFWDEFDTTYDKQPLGWLRYFIGPMQDGLFQEDQVTHPIGTSIFVFAGGTATSKDEFVNPVPDPAIDRKALKVPDFVSRLKGFLNVTGPNRRADSDRHFLIRRAVLLRSMIEKHCPDLFHEEGKPKTLQIDAGVLHAFLMTEAYHHGARSLESVIAMSALAGRKHFDSSSLPPEPQLALHVQGPFEMSIQPRSKLTQNVVLLEQLAAEAHEAFCRAKRDNGWKYNRVRNDDESVKHHDLLKSYGELRERDKERNRATIRWIPAKVAMEGYEIAPEGSATRQEMTAEQIERLAELEHEIWMKSKRAAGYEQGPKASESPKLSPYLVPWSQVPDDFRYIDRAMVNAIPKILEKARLILVKKTP